MRRGVRGAKLARHRLIQCLTAKRFVLAIQSYRLSDNYSIQQMRRQTSVCNLEAVCCSPVREVMVSKQIERETLQSPFWGRGRHDAVLTTCVVRTVKPAGCVYWRCAPRPELKVSVQGLRCNRTTPYYAILDIRYLLGSVGWRQRWFRLVGEMLSSLIGVTNHCIA